MNKDLIAELIERKIKQFFNVVNEYSNSNNTYSNETHQQLYDLTKPGAQSFPELAL